MNPKDGALFPLPDGARLVADATGSAGAILKVHQRPATGTVDTNVVAKGCDHALADIVQQVLSGNNHGFDDHLYQTAFSKTCLNAGANWRGALWHPVIPLFIQLSDRVQVRQKNQNLQQMIPRTANLDQRLIDLFQHLPDLSTDIQRKITGDLDPLCHFVVDHHVGPSCRRSDSLNFRHRLFSFNQPPATTSGLQSSTPETHIT